jgi:type I restriction enzyme S subunit
LAGSSVRYFLYALQHSREELRAKATGSTFEAISGDQLRNHPVPVAPVEEQARIVLQIEARLTDLDAAVAGLKRVQANLKRYRASVLKSACEGRLVPTEAELARREGRSYESGEQLLQRILKERRAKWEADQLTKMHAACRPPKDDDWKKKYKEPAPPDISSLPELPGGWTWASLAQIAEIQGGIQKQPSRQPKENVFPFLRVANVYRSRLELGEMHMIELFQGELDKLRLETGDLLIVEGNGSPSEIGRMAIWNGAIENCVHQNHIIRARLLGGVVAEFCAAFWNSLEGAAQVLAVSSSTSGLHTLSVSKVGRLPIPLPPLPEQQRIAADVERRESVIDASISTASSNVTRASRLRQAILKRAFEGKLVPQDPSDEPASVLLERICASREANTRLKRIGVGKKAQSAPMVNQ